MIRDEAIVTVSEAVPGLVTRRQFGRRRLASRVTLTQVHPDLWSAVQAVLRPGEYPVIVSDSEVRTAYR